MYFNGTADLSFALTQIFNYLNQTMQEQAPNYLKTFLGSVIFPVLNEGLVKSGQYSPLIADKIALDWRATE